MSVTEKRRDASNKKIKSLGIACFETLPLREDESEITLKSLDAICRRAIAALLSTQVACLVETGEHEQAVAYFKPLLNKFSVSQDLNALELRLFSGMHSKQDAIDVAWEYEAYWALVWALGLIDNISDASSICDVSQAISFVSQANSFEDFLEQCQLRNKAEILDMLDLYYRYHWATTEQRIHPETSIGELNPSIVVERRRALEWLICDEQDWHQISLDT